MSRYASNRCCRRCCQSYIKTQRTSPHFVVIFLVFFLFCEIFELTSESAKFGSCQASGRRFRLAIHLQARGRVELAFTWDHWIRSADGHRAKAGRGSEARLKLADNAVPVIRFSEWNMELGGTLARWRQSRSRISASTNANYVYVLYIDKKLNMW